MYKILSIIVLTFVFGCNKTNNYTPKQKGYPKINLPEAKYKTIEAGHPYSFEQSVHAVLQPDKDDIAEPHWVILNYPKLDAVIQITYKPIRNDMKRLQGIIDDAYKLTSKHQVRAYEISEQLYTAPSGTKATTLSIKGEVPSQFQFFTTDSSKHYLRGAIYFKTSQKNDSLAPIIDYLKQDCVQIINTLKWK
jgi:gliding motility-associated lipoprotein GldD